MACRLSGAKDKTKARLCNEKENQFLAQYQTHRQASMSDLECKVVDNLMAELLGRIERATCRFTQDQEKEKLLTLVARKRDLLTKRAKAPFKAISHEYFSSYEYFSMPACLPAGAEEQDQEKEEQHQEKEEQEQQKEEQEQEKEQQEQQQKEEQEKQPGGAVGTPQGSHGAVAVWQKLVEQWSSGAEGKKDKQWADDYVCFVI